MANQSEIASPEASESRLRMREDALVTAKSVARPGESRSGSPFKRLIVFMRLRCRDGHIAAMARVWDFVVPLAR
jgi:hypothetical protein